MFFFSFSPCFDNTCKTLISTYWLNAGYSLLQLWWQLLPGIMHRANHAGSMLKNIYWISEYLIQPLVCNRGQPSQTLEEFLRLIAKISRAILKGGCVSRVEPVSCYWKVAGLIPLVCSLKCPRAKFWTQTAPDVLVGTLYGSHIHQCMNVCMNNSKSLWTKAYPKCKLSQKFDILHKSYIDKVQPR